MRYPHYNNSKSFYNGSIWESENYIHGVLRKLDTARLNLAALPFEKKIVQSCNAVHSVKEKTAVMLEIFRSLDDIERGQLALFRLSEFMNNGDIDESNTDSQEVKDSIKINRQNYKEALKSFAPDAINNAQKKKLYSKPITLDESIKSHIAELELKYKNTPAEISNEPKIPSGCMNIM